MYGRGSHNMWGDCFSKDKKRRMRQEAEGRRDARRERKPGLAGRDCRAGAEGAVQNSLPLLLLQSSHLPLATGRQHSWPPGWMLGMAQFSAKGLHACPRARMC